MPGAPRRRCQEPPPWLARVGVGAGVGGKGPSGLPRSGVGFGDGGTPGTLWTWDGRAAHGLCPTAVVPPPGTAREFRSRRDAAGIGATGFSPTADPHQEGTRRREMPETSLPAAWSKAAPGSSSPSATRTGSHPTPGAEPPDLRSRSGPRGQRRSAGDPPSRSRAPYRRRGWLLGEGRFILRWGNRIIPVPSSQRGNLMSSPPLRPAGTGRGGLGGEGVSGLALLGPPVSGRAANHPWGDAASSPQTTTAPLPGDPLRSPPHPSIPGAAMGPPTWPGPRTHEPGTRSPPWVGPKGQSSDAGRLCQETPVAKLARPRAPGRAGLAEQALGQNGAEQGPGPTACGTVSLPSFP